MRQELQDIKNQLTQTKKERCRLEKQIDSKDQYLNTLKAKQQKTPNVDKQ